MNAEMLFNLIVVGGVAGFVAYCASYAFHVWKARNASVDGTVSGGGRVALRLPVVLLGAGAGLVLAAYVLRFATDRVGVLSASGTFTVRVPAPGSGMVDLLVAPGQSVDAGMPLARVRAPEREARAEALRLELVALEAERRIVTHQELPLDQDLVRRYQDLLVERRHLEASRDQLVPARDVVDRDKAREGANRREQLKQLTGELDRLGDELRQATARKELAELQMARIEKMAAGHAASSDEVAVKRAEVKVADGEVQKIKTQLTHARHRKEQVEDDLARLDALGTAQAASLAGEIDRLRNRLAELPGEEAPLKERLERDLARAHAKRDARLQQLDVELRQCRAELQGIEQALNVAAPFAGRVAYRDPAPNNAGGDAPVLVLEPAHGGFRLHVRLPASEVASLRRAGEVTLELQDPPRIGRAFVERRFPGRLIASRPLPRDGGHALAELECAPPAEAVPGLSKGERVSVSLRWLPPLYAVPLFWSGLALGLAGGVIVAVRLRTARRSAEVGATGDVAAVDGPAAAPATVMATAATSGVTPIAATAAAAPSAAPTTGSLETGSVGPMLKLLGSQLREAIVRGAVDPALLASIEWALDRHHVRAVRMIGGGLGEEDAVLERVAALSPQQVASPSDALDRLLRVLRTVGGPRLRQHLRQIEQAAQTDHGHPGPVRNGNGVGHHNGSGNGNGNGHGKHALIATSPILS